MRSRKLLIGLGIGGALVFCCILVGLFGRGAEPSQTPTAPAPSETPLPATPTAVPPTSTAIPPTPTPVPPTPTATPALPTPTPLPPTPTPLPTDTPVPTPTPEPERFTGRGQQVSPRFALDAGLAVFRMTHDGGSNFAIVLMNDQGEQIELLVNEIGGFNGAKAVGIEQAGTYILDITADGNWTVLIEQPMAPPSAPAPPQTFTGRGQQVSPMFILDSGLAIFRMTHDGNSNFAILLLDDKGDWIELLVNEIGAFDGSKGVGIDRSGAYILDITADGNWTISIEQ